MQSPYIYYKGDDNMNNELVKCEVCGKMFKFVSNTHLKTHNMSIFEYKQLYPYSKLKTDELCYIQGSWSRGKTYEDVYGQDKAAELKFVRSERTKIQMTDENQIKIRKEKCGLPEYYTETRRANMRNALNSPEHKIRLRNQFFENLNSGKMTVGLQSNIAIRYIKNFLTKNNIPENKCYYWKGGRSGDEFRSWTNGKLVSYDLVVYDSDDTIETILEVNGPWHFTLEEVMIDPESKATPFKTDMRSKRDVYNHDVLKINNALNISKNVYIYWLNIDKLIKITKKMDFI